jgi:4-diphosphocytidyl-2-C-methyl-D-erythritol kinase
MINLKAPAKINLVLEVLNRRDDGYHEIRSLMQTINLYDELSFELDNKVYFESDCKELSGNSNLVYKAVELVKEFTGYERGVSIKLQKNIPVSAGLGGGSSDAAATILALNCLWDLKLEKSSILKLAALLGSDVPFFINRGTAVVTGRGENLTPVAGFYNYWYVILTPKIKVVQDKTKIMYSNLHNQNFSNGDYVGAIIDSCDKGTIIHNSMFYNVFDKIAFSVYPGLDRYWNLLIKANADSIHLAGSGPSIYCVVDSKRHALDLKSSVVEKDCDIVVATTCDN